MDAGADLRPRWSGMQGQPLELRVKRRCRARVLQAARFLDVGVSPAALQSLSLIP